MLLRGATLATLDPPSVAVADLRVDGDRIQERGPRLVARPGEDALDWTGMIVLPGLVNAHTHLYSALARGMPAPFPPPRNFLEVLERVWWRLDRALDEESVRLSALVGAIEAATSGTTLLVDHHSSPSFISGSLETVREALERVGLRSVLCYEVTDRNGVDDRDEGIEENRAFVQARPTQLTRGLVGAHAGLTLSAESLGRLAFLVRETRCGLHVHVAEDKADVSDSARRYGTSLVERYARHGLLTDRSLFAHCVHLGVEDMQRVQAAGVWVAHNPRSNMNNAVGYAGGLAGNRVCLGTDGIDQDMLAEARAAFLKLRDAERPEAYTTALSMLAGGHRFASHLFGLRFGALDAGAPADLVALDYFSPTPLEASNLAGHLLFGLDRSHVRHVMVAGRVIVRDRKLTTVDAAAVQLEARGAAAELWRRMQAL